MSGTRAGTAPRAVIYARVSSEEQVEGTSLTTQQERCRAYCEAQGWTVQDVYVDAGVSGVKASRPALDAMLADVSGGGVHAVVVAKLDRLGRSIRHLLPLLGDLNDAGVAFVSISESFDTSTPMGKAHRNLSALFADLERDLIRERTQTGLAAHVRNCCRAG